MNYTEDLGEVKQRCKSSDLEGEMSFRVLDENTEYTFHSPIFHTLIML